MALDDAFTENNEPCGDHSFGNVVVVGRKVWWKVDLHDDAHEHGSPNPTGPGVTRRVLIIPCRENY